MGEANERRSRAMENLSRQIENYPRDLLQRFMSNDTHKSQQATPSEEDSEEIELHLGLSLGGRFGVDKNPKKLIRSSSIAGTFPLVREHDAATAPPVSYPSLMRTSSLPTETEEEWRKRKELQSRRRMEAKRRRNEKQRNSNTNTSASGKFEKVDLNLEEENLRDRQQVGAANRAVAVPFGLPSWAAAARQAVLGGEADAGPKRKGGFLQGIMQPCSQGSLESQGGSSSGMSDMESKPAQGSSSGGEGRSPANIQSIQERNNQEAVGSSGTKTDENVARTSRGDDPSKKPDSSELRGKEIGINAMEDMPCVFTKGDGPNGRRIEGILYKYGKGEEVRIMCVCHGSFLSPAEFVKHAGGTDVDHPLKHIVVNTSSTSFS